ncbi:MerR family transcriptional regulator [Prauserella endophytica]|uniref:helix-turn-helix domain-containing protein n=1 Tax=Prauserella endophytica TaxID=1592324 RepID=UPI001980B49C|nr:helix-turn-helix domain-containing protein [Prauserella endophytica]
MTTAQVAAYAQRHQETVLLALRRGLLVGVQAAANCSWRVHRKEVDKWIAAGCPSKPSGKHKPHKIRAA